MKQKDVGYRPADCCRNCVYAEKFVSFMFRKCEHLTGDDIYVDGENFG